VLRCVASKLQFVEHGLKTRCGTINIYLIRVREICINELLECVEWLSSDFSIDVIFSELSILNLLYRSSIHFLKVGLGICLQ